MFVWVILLLLYQTNRSNLQCPNCLTGHCIVNWDGGIRCTKCKENYYLNSNQCYKCPAYFYGPDCMYDCIGCSNELCGKNNGVCSSYCNSGYFNTTNSVCAKCPKTCNKCNDTHHCTDCIEGTYLQQLSENIYCTLCPSRCSSCTSNTTCTQCNHSHYWGTYCQNDCEHCVSDCDKRYGCSAGCIDEYYKTYNVSKSGYECNKCPASCASCTGMLHCQECKDGFYGEANYACTKCSANCQIESDCNKSNGFCTDGCRDGWSGDKCDKSCPYGCIICEQNNSSSCRKCSAGLYGDKCENNCSRNCKQVDMEQICNIGNGYCDHGCKEEFWGHSCWNDCGAGCNGSVCNRTTGVCKNGCLNDFYGDACRKECNKQCLSREKYSRRNCDYETGECLFGCTPGWFGALCDKKCNELCNATVCERNSGMCTFGCIDTGCSQAIEMIDDISTTVAGIGGGAGAGIFCLVTVVVVLSILLWKRRQQRTETSNNLPGQSQGDIQQEEDRCQNLMLNTLGRDAGLSNDSQAKTSISDSNLDVYQELNERTLTENAYCNLSVTAAAKVNTKRKTGVDPAEYQNTAASI